MLIIFINQLKNLVIIKKEGSVSIKTIFEAMICNVAEISLIHSSLTGDFESVSKSLESGIDPNAQNLSGWTPLHAAAVRGHIDVINALLCAGADPSIKDNKGTKPIDIARTLGHGNIAISLHAAESRKGPG